MKLYVTSIFKWIFAIAFVVSITDSVYSQSTEIKFFGHIDVFHEDEVGEDIFNSFSLGEHDFFVTSQITDRISFLSENVIKLTSSGGFAASIERARIKFNYAKKHSVIFGKMHTPVSYWNDTFHHGRLFFPTIDRPIQFSLVIPIHEIGLRLQGQNIGKLNFGYDIMLGNGISSSDLEDNGEAKSLTVAGHIKPRPTMRIGAGLYFDTIEGNVAGSHSGHTSKYHNHNSSYTGDVGFKLYNFSFANFAYKWETLLELTLNYSETDTLGTAQNLTSFAYLGYRLNDSNILYSHWDHADIAFNDLHANPLYLNKVALGIRHEFSYLVNVKLEYENYFYRHVEETMHHSNFNNKYEIKFQIAYGF